MSGINQLHLQTTVRGVPASRKAERSLELELTISNKDEIDESCVLGEWDHPRRNALCNYEVQDPERSVWGFPKVLQPCTDERDHLLVNLVDLFRHPCDNRG